MRKSKVQDQQEDTANELAAPGPKGKLGAMLALMQRPEGATLQAMQEVTGWQVHSVRGAIAGAIKKKLGHTVSSTPAEGGRVYRVTKGAGA